MKKYIKRPIPIQAFLWNGKLKTLEANVSAQDINKYFDYKPNNKDLLKIKTLEGIEKCPKGNYVIKGVHGEWYTCDPKIFKETYREVK